MLRILVVTFVAVIVSFGNVVAEPLRTGTWLFERPGEDLGVDIAADGSGTVMMGKADGPVTFEIDGDTLIFTEPGKGAMSFTITSRSDKALSLVSEDDWEGGLMLIKAKPVDSVAVESPPAQIGKTKNTADQFKNKAVMMKGIVGGWYAAEPNGNSRYVYFHDDGQFYMIGAQGWQGGRYRFEVGQLKLRFNMRRGFLNYLSPISTIQLNSFASGESFVVRDNYDGVTHDVVYTFDRPDHPLGPVENIHDDSSFYGRWLLRTADGRKEVWEFKSGGSVYVNRESGFEALRWSLNGDVLTIKVLTSSTQLKVRNFQRGRGFQVGPQGNPDTFLYMDGPFYAPPFDMPQPTRRELDIALAQELAISQKASATSAAINQSVAGMADMVEMMTDDIADRPYRYEWYEVE